MDNYLIIKQYMKDREMKSNTNSHIPHHYSKQKYSLSLNMFGDSGER